MKKAIDNNGMEVEVADNTVVKTVNGIHYLLTPADEAEITAKEEAYIADSDNRQKKLIRSIRAPLLAEADIQINKHFDVEHKNLQPWKKYRQALRDVTNQVDIYNIIWPTKPPILP